MLTAHVSSITAGKPLGEDDARHFEILNQAGGLVENLAEEIDEAIVGFWDTFDIQPDDYVRFGSARQILLNLLASFIMQRPVAPSEIIQEHHFTGKNADAFYKNPENFMYVYSSSDESQIIATPAAQANELEALRLENSKLQNEIAALRREKQIAEESAISAMRRRPTRHNSQRYAYASLDEMLAGMMTEAVTEGVKIALGQGKANV
jgi:hypothetical protein